MEEDSEEEEERLEKKDNPDVTKRVSRLRKTRISKISLRKSDLYRLNLSMLKNTRKSSMISKRRSRRSILF